MLFDVGIFHWTAFTRFVLFVLLLLIHAAVQEQSGDASTAVDISMFFFICCFSIIPLHTSRISGAIE